MTLHVAFWKDNYTLNVKQRHPKKQLCTLVSWRKDEMFCSRAKIELVRSARWHVYICLSLSRRFSASDIADLPKIHLSKRFWQSLATACRDAISSMEGGLFSNTSPCLNKRSWWWQIRLGLSAGKSRRILQSLTWWSPFICNDIFTYGLHDSRREQWEQFHLHLVHDIIAPWAGL